MSVKRKPYMSYSTACKLLSYPMALAFHKIHEPFTPSAPMVFGSIVDGILTSPEALQEFKVLRGKEADGRTKEGRAAKAEAAEKGLTIVSEDVWDNAQRCADNVLAHPIAGRTLNGLQTQTQVKLEGEVDGVKLLGYADVYDPENGILFDLKTTNANSFQDPAKTIYNFKWFLQLFMYRIMLEQGGATPPERAGWIAACSEGPFPCEVWWIDGPWEEIAENLFNEALRLFKIYQEYDPGDDHVVRNISPLPWMC